MAACCKDPTFNWCINQGADKTFDFTDDASTDFSAILTARITIYTRDTATQLARYTLAAGDITQPSDNILRLALVNADTQNFPAGKHKTEIWVENNVGLEASNIGWLNVTDTKEFD